MDVALADILQESDDALVVETIFSTKDQQTTGNFLVLPSPSFLKQLSQTVGTE